MQSDILVRSRRQSDLFYIELHPQDARGEGCLEGTRCILPRVASHPGSGRFDSDLLKRQRGPYTILLDLLNERTYLCIIERQRFWMVCSDIPWH